MKILEEIVKADEQRLCQVYVLGRYDDSEGEGSQYEYTYGGATATWQDQLTGYNGETITYDGVSATYKYKKILTTSYNICIDKDKITRYTYAA